MPSTSSEPISADFPFIKKNVKVFGSNIAYVDAGASPGAATVFLHGNPTSSYLWRNVIPHVAKRSRCIAPDLIGYGDSDKPINLDYRVSDHQRYIDAFLDAVLPNDKIVLVVHDWGSALGFDWASRHTNRIAGLAFMEFIPPIDAWEEFHEGSRELFRSFRDPKLGRELLIEQNVFIEGVLPSGVVRPLSDEEMTEYRRPFLRIEDREPLLRMPIELPIAGDPPEAWAKAQNYMAWLLASDEPKLFFWMSPGAIIGEARAKNLSEILKNTKTVYLGPGVHYVQEDHPHEIGREVAAWLPIEAKG